MILVTDVPRLPLNQDLVTEVRESSQAERIDRDLLVEWHQKRYNFETSRLEFGAGVKAYYRLNVLTCDKLILFLKEKCGYAIGHVRLEDPEGTFTAEELEFCWGDHTGSAKGVKLTLAGLHFSLGNLKIRNREWDLKDAHIDFEPTGSLSLASKEIFVHSKNKVTLVQPKFTLFDFIKLSVPSAQFHLGASKGYSVLPSFTLNRLGSPGFEIEEKLALFRNFGIRGNFGVFASPSPLYEIELSWYPLSSKKGNLMPMSDLKDRFYTSPWDNVVMWNQKRETRKLQNSRILLSVTSGRNQFTQGRVIDSLSVDKMWDCAAEIGGACGNAGYVIQGRAQKIRGSGRPYYTRGFGTGTFTSGSLRMSEYVKGRIRLDAAGFTGIEGLYGWYRAQAGLYGKVWSRLGVGAAYSYGQILGSPTFLFDIPAPLHSCHLRTDIGLGDLGLSGLVRYDLNCCRWVDYEVALRAKIGAFDPYIGWRYFPRDIIFGVEMRVDKALEKLRGRHKARKI